MALNCIRSASPAPLCWPQAPPLIRSTFFTYSVTCQAFYSGNLSEMSSTDDPVPTPILNHYQHGSNFLFPFSFVLFELICLRANSSARGRNHLPRTASHRRTGPPPNPCAHYPRLEEGLAYHCLCQFLRVLDVFVYSIFPSVSQIPSVKESIKLIYSFSASMEEGAPMIRCH